MSIGYTLINLDKREKITFIHTPADTMNEIAGFAASSSITTWYLLNNRGDRVAFLSDREDEYYLFGNVYKWPELGIHDYTDVTDTVVEKLLEVGILRDEGFLWKDEDDSNSFVRDLRNDWDPKAQGN